MLAYWLYIIGGIVFTYWGYIWWINHDNLKEVTWLKAVIAVILIVLGILMIVRSAVTIYIQSRKVKRF